ncbi:MAG: cation transporter [Bacilli bacterium]|nr:cation transporter [Bacilli bacterium]
MDEIKREKEIIKTSFIGIIANVLLVGFKAFVGFVAGSISIIMDALNNLTDALSSIITIIGTKLSNKRPNKKHPYGYGRIEYITSILIAALILFAGGMAIYESIKSIIDHFQNGTMPDFEIYSIVIIAVAIAVKVGIGLFFRRQSKKTDSEALDASGKDALFDSILSSSTLVGMLVAKFAGFYVEGYLGIIIGCFIIRSGIEVLKESLSSIIGNRFDKDLVTNIKNDINQIEGVQGSFDLILNSYGHNKNIGSVHIGVKDNLSSKEIQEIERNITYLMYSKYSTIITVGIYAENTNDKESMIIYDGILEATKRYKNILQIHGFYVDKVKKYINFDLVISFDEEKPYEIIESIKEEVGKNNPDYQIIINYDQDFSLS